MFPEYKTQNTRLVAPMYILNSKIKITDETKESGKYIKIYINNILHIIINRDFFLSVRSWIYKLDSDPYFIEINFKYGKTTYQYDTKEKWIEVLNIINKYLN